MLWPIFWPHYQYQPLARLPYSWGQVLQYRDGLSSPLQGHYAESDGPEPSTSSTMITSPHPTIWSPKRHHCLETHLDGTNSPPHSPPRQKPSEPRENLSAFLSHWNSETEMEIARIGSQFPDQVVFPKRQEMPRCWKEWVLVKEKRIQKIAQSYIWAVNKKVFASNHNSKWFLHQECSCPYSSSIYHFSSLDSVQHKVHTIIILPKFWVWGGVIS